MWRMLQQDKPEDFVLATGEMHYVREFVEKAFRVVGVEIRSVRSPKCSTTRFYVKRCRPVAGLERASMRSGLTLRAAKLSCGSTPSTSVRPKSSKRERYFSLCCVELSATVPRQLLGRPAKAERLLGWKREVDFESLVKEMVEADLNASKSLVEDHN